MMPRIRTLASILGLLLALAGCEEDVIVIDNSNRPQPPGQPVATPTDEGGEGEPDAGVDVQPTQYRDEDFVEAETNRDPFRNYAALFIATAPEVENDTRDVVMPDTGVEEMRVIGIITGMSNPHAMIIDRLGIGHTVRRGDWLGRNEVVQAGGTEELPVTLNWRVERIRANQVVITREDPTAPNRPPLTRVLPLRDEQEEAALGTGMRMRVQEQP